MFNIVLKIVDGCVQCIQGIGQHTTNAFICLELVVILGAVYELNKSYDQVFIVIGGVYVVDALVFAAAALLQNLRQQRRRLSATTTTQNFNGSRGTRFQLSSEVHLSSHYNAAPAVTVPSPLFSVYGTVAPKAVTATV